MHNIKIIAVLCIVCSTCCASRGDDELLLCKPASSVWKPNCSNSSSVARPGKQGPKGEKGSEGLRGAVGPAGSVNTSEIEQLNQKIQSMTDLVMGMISRQYHVDTTARTWSAARAYCKSIGADLVTHGLRNPIIRKYIFDNLIKPLGRRHGYWVGLTDSAEEGTWMWIDGVAVTPENSFFNPGEPNDIGGGGIVDCGQLYGSNHKLDDYSCTGLRRVICEWKCPCGGAG